MYHLRLLKAFVVSALQNVLAYRLNLWISLLHALLNVGTGVLGVWVLFEQVHSVRGWTFPATLALLGVYLTLSALRGLVFGPSLDALAGLEGEIHSGNFDFMLLRPVNVQFLASFRHWRPLALLDLALGLGVLGVAIARLGPALAPLHIVSFLIALGAGLGVLYAILLAFAALAFWSPGFMFTWLFDSFLDLGRYPLGLYPGWLRLVLTWIVPVGVITTVPAQALAGGLDLFTLAGSVALAVLLLLAASILFRVGLRRYAGASG